MGNISATFKRFITNKNTVTIFGVIGCVLILWLFYNNRVNKAISPILVPYAKNTIGAASIIEADDIGFIEINSKFAQSINIALSDKELIGKYVTTGTSIPEGGLFYKNQIVEKEALPNTVFDHIPKGYTIFSLPVNNQVTFGNSIYPGDKIDLYVKARDGMNNITFGKFIERIEVLAVRDSNGKNVFDSVEPTSPAALLFAVPDEMFTLLTQASFISELEILPVPRNKEYTSEAGETEIKSEEIKSYILARTTTITE